MSVSRKIRKWYDSIEAFEFEGIAESIMEVMPEANQQNNQYLESLLARLTHSYVKYHEKKAEDSKTGLVIYKLTCCLCERFTESSNPPRVKSGIFHITRCLRESGLFSESKEICKHVMPGKIFSADVIDNEYYLKLSYSWRQSAENLIKSLSLKFDPQSYEILLEIIKFDFELLKHSGKTDSYCKILFTRLQKYIERVTSCGEEWTESKIIKFFEDIIRHIKMMQENSILEIDPLLIYDEVIDSIHALSWKMINITEINELYGFVNTIAKEFQVFLEDSQARKCFQLHLDFYKTVLKPVSKFDANMAKEIASYRHQFRRNKKIFGPSKNMIANSRGINELLNPLCNYWLKCMESCETESINQICFQLVRLINEVSSLFAAQSIQSCKCNLQVCKAKTNAFEEINIIEKCLVFICMFDKRHISKDLLEFSHNLLSLIITSIATFKETNCGLYSTLWNNCGVIMYNLSSLASVEFLDECAELLSNLCCYIIKEDGVKNTIKFLDTSNSLSLVLYKLSGIYLKAKKYREAMIVCAFNGLISYEDATTKAFKMWKNIKIECNSDEMLTQTMVACLKTYKSAISVIGFEIDFNDFDLFKLCVKEIQGLSKTEVNLTSAIKASLNELDSIRSNSIEFVEGVQYLGYQVFYFNDNSNIIKYVEKAETYLNDYYNGSKSHSKLKNNLKFFKSECKNRNNKNLNAIRI